MANANRISDEQLHTLALIGKLESLADFYLVGGTAVAYHLGHRTSLDLDLFSHGQAIDLDRVRRDLVSALNAVEVISASDVAVHLKIGDTPVDIVSYPYPPLEKPAAGPAGFAVASLVDLAPMKLAAIAKRGIKRDFWDLYEILTKTKMSLPDALTAYTIKFGRLESDQYYLVRSLTYFDDAERESVFPRGMSADLWNAIKKFFWKNAPEALKSGSP